MPRLNRHLTHKLARLVIGLACLGLTSRAYADETLFDGIAAQVGSEIVLLSEVDHMAKPIEERMRKMGAPKEEIATMRAEVLDRLIESKLLSAAVKRLELTASDEEVEAAIDGIAADTRLTRAQLEESVVSHGLTLEEYRAKIRSEIERSKVLNSMVRSQVRVEPEEVEARFQEQFGAEPEGGSEVHLRHVVVMAGPDLQRDIETACQMANTVVKAVREKGEVFIEAAKALAVEPGVGGGDLGWVHEKEAADWMRDAIRALEPGQISDAIETRMGCQVLELVEKRSFKKTSFEEARAAIEKEIFRSKMETEYTKWVETLREQTYVDRKTAFQIGAPLPEGAGNTASPSSPLAPAASDASGTSSDSGSRESGDGA